MAQSIPRLPDVPEELHGEPVVMVAGTFIGPADQGTTVLAPFQELGDLVPGAGPDASAMEQLVDVARASCRFGSAVAPRSDPSWVSGLVTRGYPEMLPDGAPC